MDDGGARFEESQGLSGLVARFGDDEHYPYKGICQEGTVGVISVHSSGRTRSWGVQGRVGSMRIRGFMWRNRGYHAQKLDIVVHVESRKWTAKSKSSKGGSGKAKGKCSILGCPSQVSSLRIPFIAMTRSLNFESRPVTLPFCHVLCKETRLCDRHWNGRLGQIDLRTEIKCSSACFFTTRAPLYPQSRPRRNEPFL